MAGQAPFSGTPCICVCRTHGGVKEPALASVPPQASAGLGDPNSEHGKQGLPPSRQEGDSPQARPTPGVLWAAHRSHTCLFAPEPQDSVDSKGGVQQGS